jgi:hypothetical protein
VPSGVIDRILCDLIDGSYTVDMHAEAAKLFLPFYWAALDNFGGLPGRVGASMVIFFVLASASWGCAW